jgi:hypothetical protein
MMRNRKGWGRQLISTVPYTGCTVLREIIQISLHYDIGSVLYGYRLQVEHISCKNLEHAA